MRTIVCKIIDVNPTTGEQLCYKEIAGLSTDTKPITGLVTGSVFEEVNTGTFFQFVEGASAGEEWVEEFTIQE